MEVAHQGGQRGAQLQLREVADESDERENGQREERGSAQMPVTVCIGARECLGESGEVARSPRGSWFCVVMHIAGVWFAGCGHRVPAALLALLGSLVAGHRL